MEKRLAHAVLAFIGSLFLVVHFASAVVNTVRYSVIDLGVLSGGTQSLGSAINNLGQVTGDAYTSTGQVRAFLYSNGTMVDLGTLGSTISSGRAINDNGSIVGESTATPNSGGHAFLYQAGQMTDIGQGTQSLAFGINNNGWVTGNIDGIGGQEHAFLFDGQHFNTLGGAFSNGYGINNLGQVVGRASATSSSPVHAFVYGNGQMTDLGTLGGTTSGAQAINDSGQIIGYSTTNTDTHFHAFLYSQGAMSDLGTLYGYDTFPQSINGSGQIVGAGDMFPDGGYRPFLYSNGVMLDLNTLIDPGSRWTLTSATGINDNGWITGYGNGPAGLHAFVLVPVPEPGSFVLAGFASLALFRRNRKGQKRFRIP